MAVSVQMLWNKLYKAVNAVFHVELARVGREDEGIEID
jgi:hypothetical protein